MKKIDYLSTLFVGIDIGSRLNVISALNFEQDFLIRMVPIPNAQYGAEQMEQMIAQVLEQHHEFRSLIIALNPPAFTVYISPITFPPVKGWHPSPPKSTASIPRKWQSIKNPLIPLTKTTGLIPLSLLISPGLGGFASSRGAGHSILPYSDSPGTGFTLQSASPGRKLTCSITSF